MKTATCSLARETKEIRWGWKETKGKWKYRGKKEIEKEKGIWRGKYSNKRGTKRRYSDVGRGK